MAARSFVPFVAKQRQFFDQTDENESSKMRFHLCALVSAHVPSTDIYFKFDGSNLSKLEVFTQSTLEHLSGSLLCHWLGPSGPSRTKNDEIALNEIFLKQTFLIFSNKPCNFIFNPIHSSCIIAQGKESASQIISFH